MPAVSTNLQSNGSKVHILGAGNSKARSPFVFDLDPGATNKHQSAGLVVAYGCKCWQQYKEECDQWRALKVVTKILNWKQLYNPQRFSLITSFASDWKTLRWFSWFAVLFFFPSATLINENTENMVRSINRCHLLSSHPLSLSSHNRRSY